MPLPISSLIKAPKAALNINLPNIQKFSKPLGVKKGGTIDVSLDESVSEGIRVLQKGSPHSVEQLQFIDRSLGLIPESERDVLRPILNRALTLRPSDISAVYKHIDTELKSNNLALAFTNESKPKLKGNLTNAIKSKFRGVDQSFKNISLRQENKLLRTIQKRGNEHLASFNLLIKNPTRFKELYKLSQDEFAAELIAPSGARSKVVNELVEDFRAWDQQSMAELQASGVPIGSIDGYAAPLSMSVDSLFELGEKGFKEAFTAHVDNVAPERLNDIIAALKKNSISTDKKEALVFPTRKLKFKTPKDEIEFYKKMNGIKEGDGYSLLNDMLVHKKGNVRKASIVAEFGVDPKQTFKKVLKKLKENKESLTKEEVLNFSKIETNFNRLVDNYNGIKKVDSIFAERLGESVSATTTFFTSASGSSVLRNLFDFIFNKSAVSQAIYNPKYTLGSNVLGLVETVGYLTSHALGGRASRKGVDKVLDIMGFGSQLDTLSHFNLLSYENMYDVTTPLSKLDSTHSYINNALHQVNNTMLTISGQNSFTDFTRARHLVTAQQHWTNMLDNVKGYDDWISTLSPLEKKQAKYMEQAFGIGKDEFDALKKAQRQSIKGKIFGKDIPQFITSETILKSEIGDQFFKRELAVKWQNLNYNSTLNATPVPTLADSVTGKTGLNNASSWMRFILRPFLKFADVADSQMQGVIDRVALASYGDRSKSLGFDKSMVNYTRAALTYTGSFMGIIWLKDMLYNRPPTDFTQKDKLMGAFIQSGFGGYPMSVLNQVFSLYGGSTGGGLYGSAPFGGVIRGGKSLVSGLTSDDPKDLYKAMRQFSRMSGPGVLWYTRGMADKALQQALLTPAQRRKLRKRQRGK